MAKLYFKYGTMGSSKTANLLMTKFNYEQKGMNVLLIKPSIDHRDGESTIKSRIGIESEAIIIRPDDYINNCIFNPLDYNVIIADESQFFTSTQIDQLHDIAIYCNIPIICYGLLTDFQTHLFEGSKRLIEVSESIQEIKTVCRCGSKATVNARIVNGEVITDGEQIQLGSDESYESMCYKCWDMKINR